MFSIVFRALQGIGGSGAYALVVVVFFKIGPETRFAFYTGLVSLVFAFALLVGPLIGGRYNHQWDLEMAFLDEVYNGYLSNAMANDGATVSLRVLLTLRFLLSLFQMDFPSMESSIIYHARNVETASISRVFSYCLLPVFCLSRPCS